MMVREERERGREERERERDSDSYLYLDDSVSCLEYDIGGVTVRWVVVSDLVHTLVLQGVGNCREGEE